MATLINNAGVQHYANKMVLAENRKVGSKSLPTALNDIDNLIDEMKTHFDAEYCSALDMRLSNNTNVFSIGTGSEADKRSEIENSFTDVELSGNSLVNLVSSEIKSMTSTRTSGWHQDRSYKYSDMIKPNTTYTIVCQVLKNTLSTPFGMGGGTKTYNQLNFNTFKNFAPKETGIKISVVQSYDEWDKTQALILFPQFGNRGEEQGLFEIGETIEYRFMIFEGDYSNNPPTDFFQGLKSIGEKEDGNHKISISSVGKNLFDKSNKIIKGKALAQHDGLYDDSTMFSSQFIKVKPSTTYGLTQVHWGWYCDVNKKKLSNFSSNHTGTTLTTPSNCHYIRVSGKIDSLDLVQIECNNKITNCEPYKENKKEILLNEPLRGLPNGVKDTIEKINGEWKIVRRCREVVFDGSQSVTGVSNLTTDDEWSKFGYELANCKDFGLVLCDTLPYQVDKRGINPDLGQYISCTNDKWKILFQIKKVNNSPSTASQVGEYMLNNPKRVIYELATPIIEDISPVTLQCWKNGTISIDEILPVETTHTVALNKPAQIKRNIEELTALRKRVQALEDFYDQIALEQAHQLSLINHSIELDYDI